MMGLSVTRSAFHTVLMLLFVETYTEGLQTGPVLTVAQRMAIFGTNSSVKLPPIEYVNLERLNSTNPRPLRKRPANLLRYRLALNGEKIDFTLRQNKDLLTPGCLVHHHQKNGQTILYPCARSLARCFYKGRSDKHRNAWAAVNTCGGLKGVISMKNSSYIIAPLHGKSISKHGFVNETHVIYRYTSDKTVCMATGSARTDSLQILRRNKRDKSPVEYIETRVAVDPSVHEFHGNESEEYVQTVFNIASRLFEEQSIGTEIKLSLSEIHIYETYDQIGVRITRDAEKTLNDYCQWQAQNTTSTPDCTVFLTRLNIQYKGFDTTVGLANEGMCQRGRNCAIVQDVGVASGAVMAHEVGHLLYMIHDEDTTCKGHAGIMGTGSTGTNAFRWSSCSAAELKQFLSTNQSMCLANKPDGLELSIGYNRSYPPPGTLYTRDKQCQLLLGNQASYCRDQSVGICDKLSCRKTPKSPCVTYDSIVIDGTDCNNTHTWCMSGLCVAMDNDSFTPPVDGAWTDWDAHYSPCTRTCGGGVKVKRRRCISPKPQYGGKACSGISLVASMCNIQSCLQDYKTTQCSEKGSNKNTSLSWRPMLAMGDESCLIWCETTDGRQEIKATDSNHTTKDPYYKDGTECDIERGAPYGRCIDGRCRMFGCDGIMESGKVYDNCGVCNGTGTDCRRVSGSYNKNGVVGNFTTVVMIPQDSYGVKVWQKNMYCFLSTFVNGKRVFNKDRHHRLSGTYHVEHIRMRYTQTPEKLEIDGPLTTAVKIQIFLKRAECGDFPFNRSSKVYQIYDGNGYVGVTPDITYEYYHRVTSHTSPYHWSRQYTPCSKTCGTGHMTPSVRCVHLSQGFVEDSWCDIANKPNEFRQLCNTHFCPPSWRVSEFGVCSKTCGPGGRRLRRVVCTTENNDTFKIVHESRCDVTSRPASEVNCTNNPCPAVWKVGPWSQCSKTCSEGIRLRRTRCFRPNGTLTADQNCGKDSKPATMQVCTNGACPQRYGTACKDVKPNCKLTYGSDVCYGNYSKWAELNCAKDCGVCSPKDDPLCQTLAAKGTNICVVRPIWGNLHCPQMCANAACNHTDDPQCAGFSVSGVDVCNNVQFAKNRCPHLCGMCGQCKDTQKNCSQYNKAYCLDVNYGAYLKAHCAKYCGFC